jgi:hypothetical protein
MGETRVVKWLAGWTEQDFATALVKAGGLERGALVLLDYGHDDWCPKLDGGACRCDPDVVATVRPAARGAA